MILWHPSFYISLNRFFCNNKYIFRLSINFELKQLEKKLIDEQFEYLNECEYIFSVAIIFVIENKIIIGIKRCEVVMNLN